MRVGDALGLYTTKGSGQPSLGRLGQITQWNFRLPQKSMNWMIRAELKPAK